MDYRLNNEAIVACVAAQVVKHGCRQLPAVVVTTNLLMRDQERKRLASKMRKKKTTFVCKVDGGLLTIIMNSLVLLIKGGCMKFADGELSLTSSGYLMCEQMEDGRGDMLNEILKDLPALLEQMEKMEDVIEDKRYVIAI